jgi:hypothetical protein
MRNVSEEPRGRLDRGLLLAVVAVTASCNWCPPAPVVPPKESFMLAYVDSTQRIRVRYSDDGLSWSLGDPQSATADAGIGAAASEDGVGVTRILVHNGNVGRFHFRFGLGPQVWDATDKQPGSAADVPTAAPSMRGVPQVAYGSSPGWLVTNLGGGSGFVPTVLRYSSSSGTLTDVSPGATELNLGSLNVLQAPAIVSHAGRVVLAHLRHNGIGNSATLADLRILAGNIGSGGVPTWSAAYTFNPSETGYGPPVSRPALGYNNRQFLLGVLRQATAGGALRLFIHGSNDGLSWLPVRTFDQVPPQPPDALSVGLAGKSDGTMVVMFTAPGVAKMYRSTGGGWSEVAGTVVFSLNTPNWYPVALISAGQPPPP